MRRLIWLLAAGVIAAVVMVPASAQSRVAGEKADRALAARGHYGSGYGDVCGTRVTYRIRGDQIPKRKIVVRKGFRVYLFGDPTSEGTVAIYLNPGYQLCWMRVSGSLDAAASNRYYVWPFARRNGPPSLSVPLEAVATVVIGRIAHPRGTNCGRDAYRAITEPGQGSAGETKLIHLGYGVVRSWSGKGLRFCTEREVAENGQVLWISHNTKAGSHPSPGRYGGWFEVTAKRK